jgi:hypothetical protein
LDAAHDALKALTGKLNQCSASSASLGKILDVRRRLHNYDVRPTNIFFPFLSFSWIVTGHSSVLVTGQLGRSAPQAVARGSRPSAAPGAAYWYSLFLSPPLSSPLI